MSKTLSKSTKLKAKRVKYAFHVLRGRPLIYRVHFTKPGITGIHKSNQNLVIAEFLISD